MIQEKRAEVEKSIDDHNDQKRDANETMDDSLDKTDDFDKSMEMNRECNVLFINFSQGGSIDSVYSSNIRYSVIPQIICFLGVSTMNYHVNISISIISIPSMGTTPGTYQTSAQFKSEN